MTWNAIVARTAVSQVSKPAVSPISKSADPESSTARRVWKPATQQVWKPAIRLSALLALCYVGVMFNALNAATNDLPEGNRFLFVVETSSASSKLEHGGRQAAFDLIFTGIYGQMRAGDTFGLWTFNENVFAGFYPMQSWSPEHNMDLAANVGQFLKKQSYEKTGRLGNAIKHALSVANTVKDVNIFLVSDPGNDPDDGPVGPGYGSEYQERAAQARAKKKPLITTIVAKNGSVSNWFVTIAGDPVRLPAYAVPERVKPEPANAPIVEAKPAVPRAPRAPIIIKGTPEQHATTSPRASAADDAPPPLGRVLSMSSEETRISSLQTNWLTSNERVASVERVGSSTNAVASAKAEPPPVTPRKIEPTTTAAVLALSQPSAGATATLPKSESREHGSHPTPAPKALPAALSLLPATKVAAREPQIPAEPQGASVESRPPDPPSALNGVRGENAATTSANQKSASHETSPALNATVAMPDYFLSPRAMLIIGAALLLLAMILTALFVQHLRRAATPSFISRSMERR